MSLKIYATEFFKEIYAIRADFADRSSQVDAYIDGAWVDTKTIVNDYLRCDPGNAMYAHITDEYEKTGGKIDPFLEEVETSVAIMDIVTEIPERPQQVEIKTVWKPYERIMQKDTPISNVQRQVLELIIRYKRVNDCSPSITWIAKQRGTNKSGAAKQIKALENKGYIERIPGRRRTIKLLRAPDGLPIDRGEYDEPMEPFTPKGEKNVNPQNVIESNETQTRSTDDPVPEVP